MDIAWLVSIIGANAVGFLAAGLWYRDWAFGHPWRRATGVTPERSASAGGRPMLLVLVCNLVTAIVLEAFVSAVADGSTSHAVWPAIGVGVGAWLAFSATTLVTHHAFELKPAVLTVINSGYQLALFVSMSLVIGLVHQLSR